MAKKKPYLPKTEAGRAIMLHTMADNLPGHALTITAITPADVTQTAADDVFNTSMVALLADMKAFTKNLTAFRDLESYGPIGATPAAPPMSITIPTPVPTGIFARVSNLSQRIKADPNYTEAIGIDLGIVGEDHVVDIPNSKPILEFFKEPHGWRIEFNLLSFFEGVSIYKKLPSAAGFTHLAVDRHAPYIDNSPVENETQYYAFFMIGDNEVGLQSDISTLKVD